MQRISSTTLMGDLERNLIKEELAVRIGVKEITFYSTNKRFRLEQGKGRMRRNANVKVIGGFERILVKYELPVTITVKEVNFVDRRNTKIS